MAHTPLHNVTIVTHKQGQTYQRGIVLVELRTVACTLLAFMYMMHN